MLFAAMICIAAVNRLRLSPKIASDGAIKALDRNAPVEAGLGLIIQLIVAALGSLDLGMHNHAGHLQQVATMVPFSWAVKSSGAEEFDQ